MPMPARPMPESMAFPQPVSPASLTVSQMHTMPARLMPVTPASMPAAVHDHSMHAFVMPPLASPPAHHPAFPMPCNGAPLPLPDGLMRLPADMFETPVKQLRPLGSPVQALSLQSKASAPPPFPPHQEAGAEAAPAANTKHRRLKANLTI